MATLDLLFIFMCLKKLNDHLTNKSKVINGETAYKKVVHLSKEDMFEKYAV